MPRVQGIFLQLDVDYAENKDIAPLLRYGKEARAVRDLLVQMWCYCKRHKSDGHVPVEQIGKLAYPDTPQVGLRDADRLVAVGIAQRTDEGYFFPDYLKRNKSRAQIEAESVQKAEAGRVGGLVSGMVRKEQAEAKQSAKQENPAASDSLNTETETYPEPQSQPPVEKKLSGERHQTSPASNATEPICTTHPLGDAGDMCGGCGKVRAWRDRAEADAKAATVAAAKSCDRCHGTNWLETADGLPAGKCDHRRVS